MGKEYALKNIRIKDSKISKISMCGTGGCGLVHYHESSSYGIGNGFIETMKYLYDKTTSTITPKSKEKLQPKN